MKKNCLKSFLSLALVVLGLAMPSNAMADSWTGTAIDKATASSTAPMYLYNEKLGAWLNIGGKWGTQCATNADYGVSIIGLTANSDGTYTMETALEASTGSGQGHCIGYVYAREDATDAENNTVNDNGLFCDRGTGGDDAAGITKWTFTGDKDGYTISCEYNGSNYYITATSTLREACTLETTPVDGYSTWKVVTFATITAKLQTSPASWTSPTNITYLIKDANVTRASTEEDEWATSDWNVLTSGSGTASYEPVTSVTSGNTYYISDGTNYLTLSGTTIGSTTTASNATAFTVTYYSGYGYVISSGSYYLSLTQGGKGQSRSLTCSTSATTWSFYNGYFYYQGNSNTYYITYNSGWTVANSAPSNSRTYELTSGGTSAEGLVFGGQYYKRPNSGTYASTASTYYGTTENDPTGTYQRNRGKYFGAQVRGASGKVAQTVKVYYSGWYEVSCQGAFYNADKTSNDVAYLYVNADGTEVKAAFDCAEKDEWDAVQELFFQKSIYKTSVQFKVTMDNANDKGYDEDGKTISIGVLLDAAKAAYGDWTAFDDFQIEFLGSGNELILKENTDNYSYLLDYDQDFENCTMYLNRTFTEKKWNTLVLPVALNKGQFVGAFGATARAASLDHVESGILHFVTIQKTGKTDASPFLEANRPYIVYIESNPTETKYQTVRYGTDDKNIYVHVGVNAETGENTPYYTVPFVSLNKNTIKNTYGKLITIVDGTEVEGKYTITDQDNSDRSVTFDGTLLKTYSTTTTDNGDGTTTTTGTITTGFDNMVGNMIFKGGVMYYIATDYGMKAYRAWLKPNNYVSQNINDSEKGDNTNIGGGSKLTISIDGVEDSTTDIYDLNVDKNTTSAQKYQSGVYGINGQMISKNASIENLPKGIYIVNGKKYIVK